MLQQINKKILLYFFIFIILGTFNNKNLKEFNLPKINSLKINGLEIDQKFSEKLEILKIDNIFFIDKIKTEELFNSNNLIEEYEIFKKYPMSLEIEIVELNFYQTNIDGKFFLIGSNGKLIENENNTNSLPFLFGDIEIIEFLKLKKIIDYSNFNFKEIKNLYFFPSGRWDVETLSNVLIKLPKDRLKESLDLSLNLLNNEKFENIKLIDVRQKNQVIIND